MDKRSSPKTVNMSARDAVKAGVAIGPIDFTIRP